MQWYFWVMGALAIMTAVMIYVKSRIQKAGESAKEEMARRFGDDVQVLTGCGIVSPPSRVPGVLVLLKDRIVYRSLSALAGGEGEIPLAGIGRITWERSWASRHHMARKYRNAKIIGVTTMAGEEKVFAISNRDAEKWEEALREFPLFQKE